MLLGDDEFTETKRITGVEPTDSTRSTENMHVSVTANALNLYDKKVVTLANLSNGRLSRELMLLRLRPSNHTTSASAIYVWAQISQTVGHLTDEIYFLRYGQRPKKLKYLDNGFLFLPDNKTVFGWDEGLGNVFKHNMTVLTNAER